MRRRVVDAHRVTRAFVDARVDARSPSTWATRARTRATVDAREADDGDGTRPSGRIVRAPVVVLGAGPTGLTLGAVLRAYGVPFVALEREKTTAAHPRAHYVNTRTMEVFRGVSRALAEEVLSGTPPLEEWRWFRYVTALVSGAELGAVDQFGGASSASSDASPTRATHFSQHRLTRALEGVANGSTVGLGGGTLRGVRAKEVLERADGVTVRAEDVESGEALEVRAEYCVVADGANSETRDGLGIAMIGDRALQHLINVHFKSAALAADLRSNPAMLYFVFNEDVVAVVVAHDLGAGEFVAQIPFLPPVQDARDFTPSVCERLLRSAIGWRSETSKTLDILEVRPWTMSAEVSETFSRGNRIFVAGDAAHRFPPSGGFGMNTGIQDAHNLAWKLASVIRGLSSPELLHTYEAERRPVAIRNTKLSLENFKSVLKIPNALGLPPIAANALRDVISNLPSMVPNALRKGILETGLAVGRAQCGPLLTTDNPIGAQRRAAVKRMCEDPNGTLRLQFPKEDVGFSYEPADENGCARLHTPGTLSVGVRVPHAWVQTTRGVMSTLDIVDEDVTEPRFTLFSRGFDGEADSLHRLITVSCSFPIRIIHLVGAPTDSSSEAFDAHGVWFSKTQRLGDKSLVLVRPDGHVAWIDRDPSTLASAFRRASFTIDG